MSNEQKPRIYVGNGKQNSAGGINIGLNLSKIPKDMIKTTAAGDKWINITVWPNREPDKFGKTHNVVMDTFEPKQTEAAAVTAAPAPAPKDDLPF